MMIATVPIMGSGTASDRGINGGNRVSTATSESRFGRPVLLWIMAAAIGFLGCSSTGKPTGSGGSGAGGAGGADAGLGGAGMGGVVGTGGMVGMGGADGGTVRRCHTNADCAPMDAGTQDGSPRSTPGGVCFIQAPVTDCTTGPEGICVSTRDGNCGANPNPCQCILPAVSDTACAPFQGTTCNYFRGSDFSITGCYGCFVIPDAGISDGGDGG
jgi:hypothetical protein